jgi:hypothetical protein
MGVLRMKREISSKIPTKERKEKRKKKTNDLTYKNPAINNKLKGLCM